MGHRCGPTENYGDALTYWIYTPDKNQCVSLSLVSLASDPTNTKKRVVPDPNVPRNDKLDFDTNSKGSGKGKERPVSLKSIIDSVREEKGIDPTETPPVKPSELLEYNCLR